MVTVVGIGYLIYWIMPSIPLISAFALAAVLSPTDAVALSSIVGKGANTEADHGVFRRRSLNE